MFAFLCDKVPREGTLNGIYLVHPNPPLTNFGCKGIITPILPVRIATGAKTHFGWTMPKKVRPHPLKCVTRLPPRGTRCDMRHELLTQCALFCTWSQCKKKGTLS